VTDVVRDESNDRIWTIPNALSILRLLGVPVFLWLLLGPEQDGWAIGILMVSGVTDWADGVLARKLNQQSAFGRYSTRWPTGCTSWPLSPGWSCAR
jgi:cardiolipin synthase